MRVDVAPFNDVRVRQAIRLCMDRKQAIATALVRTGRRRQPTPTAGSTLTSTLAFKRDQDIEQAK